MATLRTEPYIWTTWLTKILVGEQACEWAAWFRAHHQGYEKVPDSFDKTAWLLEHTSGLRKACGTLIECGHTVAVEGQNEFKLRSPTSGITLAGRPDIVAMTEGAGVVADVKTGQQRASDSVQVMIYMWALPRALKIYRGIPLSGRVIYGATLVEIPAAAIDDGFGSKLATLIQRVGGRHQLARIPSSSECRFCDITKTACPERVETEPIAETTNDF